MPEATLPSFSYVDIAKRSLKLSLAHIYPMMGASILFFVGHAALGWVGTEAGFFGAWLSALMLPILSLCGMLGFAQFCLRAVRAESTTMADFIPPTNRIIWAIPTAIIYYIGLILGTLALIVPGIVLVVGTSIWVYIFVDRNTGPVDTLKQAWALTDGHKLWIFWGMCASIGCLIAGFIPLVLLLGLITASASGLQSAILGSVAILLTYLAVALANFAFQFVMPIVYETLVRQQEAKAELDKVVY